MKWRVLVLLAMAALWATFTAHARAATVAVEGGLLEGLESSTLRVFKGIAYAAPPLGELRWRAPQAPAAWTGVKKAHQFSPACPQLKPYPAEWPPEAMGEDCLTLNIWAPAKRSKPLPVMVWIHGGGLEGGSGSMALYAGDRLAERGALVVSFNYRLGVLGFLAHPGLSQESPQAISGNYGLLDQIAALQWVQRNIAAFGGDPDRVTLFGQSSGAIAISALVTSPLAKGLFHRVIAQSGGLFEPIELDPGFTPGGAAQRGSQFAARAGATSLAELRQMPVQQLLKTRFAPQFNIDGVVLTRSPFAAYARGEHHDVDVLLGANRDEGQAFLEGVAVTKGNMGDVLASRFPAALVHAVGVNAAEDDGQARAIAAAFETDMRFRWNMWAWAGLAADRGTREVFFYQFSRTPPYPSGARHHGQGATHGMELPYAFDQLDLQALPWAAKDRELASAMAAYWVNFATTGNPNGAGLPRWPSFRTAREQVMNLGEALAPQRIADLERLQRIDQVYTALRPGH